ncbi:Copia protein OS=Drosophila melanogaster GN=GIP PE=1 SV=3 [Rhizoctonia solani AG-1 IB]|uniref:Copia protein n=1 Tax=Thanatephorus cucumeris (strain AG1-IB / isolate 7/3/14) TaxID=1108050 RepID=A0A0B7G1E7_THACB|nr:Copia protein OS=Drosophila melanogaster GN=GIP PE=1 SV=3 [Rhizoctonia solani AG-1 IB]
MRHKSEAVDKFIAFANLIRTQKGHEIKRLHFDNGKELINTRLREFCATTGTEITTTAPYSSQQNGPAERANRTLADHGRSMMHGHSNTRDKTYLWQEAFAYGNMISNNLPHKIKGEWRVPQIEMYGKAIDMSFFQLFGTTCHVLIQQKGHSKIEAKTRKAIFTGIERNTGGAWRYLALPDRAIRTSRNVFFPRHLPDPASSDIPQPVLAPDNLDAVSPDRWIQVFAPSEGEMATKSENNLTTHTSSSIDNSTRHNPQSTIDNSKPTHTNTPTQGETSNSSEKSANRPPATEHTHRPTLPSKTPLPPTEQSVPGLPSQPRRITTRRQAATESTPYKHEMLDPKTGKARALWLEALNILHKQTTSAIHDPEDIIPIDNTNTGTSRDTSSLPIPIINCFSTMHKNRDDDLPCFHAWVAQNYSALTQPRDTIDNDSPKWADALKSNRKEEWIAAVGDEFTVLIKQKYSKSNATLMEKKSD